MSGRSCKYSADCLWYVCGELIEKKHCLGSCIYAKEAYYAQFGMLIGDQGRPWAPHIKQHVNITVVLLKVGSKKRKWLCVFLFPMSAVSL